MRLQSIRLAGFKSFVEPTKIPFPLQLTGVVGPNGCGKSNVIDAVRWVLGESSARNLRGEAMTDVIFNGSTQRAPASKASVELNFDNSSGRLAGEYGKYNEVAVRREVTRDGQNIYFLNGTRCRKKDITDLFLGTGLGPRSYAIIEQGMISRLIESKPQELRVFLDEAAGVSKYKERRRETENRIRHSQENLQRLTDIEAELTAQVEKLRGQSESARRFRRLRDHQRELKQQQTLAQLMKLDQHLATQHQQEHQQSQQLAILEARVDDIDTQELLLKEQQADISETIDHLRAEQTQLVAKLARLEEQVTHRQQDEQQREQQQVQFHEQIETLTTQLDEYQRQWAQSGEQLALVTEERDIQQQQIEMLQEQLEQANVKRQQDSEYLQQAQYDHQQAAQQLTKYQEQLHGADELYRQAQQRYQSLMTQLDQETPTIDLASMEQQVAICEAQLEMAHTHDEHLQAQFNELTEQLTQAQLHQQKANQQQFANQTQRQALTQLLASLSAENYQAESPLRKKLVITAGWESAVEKVLQRWLFAETDPQAMTAADLAVYPPRDAHHASAVNHEMAPALAQQVQGAPENLLAGIYCAEDREHAHALLQQLPADASVITPQGHWYSQTWHDCYQAIEGPSLLESQQQLHQLESQSQSLDEHVEQGHQQVKLLEHQLADIKAQRQQTNAQRQQAQQAFQQASQQMALSEQQLSHHKAQQTQLNKQIEFENQQMTQALEHQQQIATQLENMQETFESTQRVLLAAQELAQKSAQNHQQLSSQLQQIERKAHQYALQYQQYTNQQQQLATRISESQRQLTLIRQQLTQLTSHESNEQSIAQYQAQIEQLRQQQLTEQQVLEGKESQRAQWVEQQTQLGVERKTLQQQVKTQQQSYQQNQVSSAELQARRRVLLEQLSEAGVKLEAESYQQVDLAIDYQQEIDKVERQLKRLGAVNLAAEQEFEQQQARLNELSAQITDLRDALELLNRAIAKIDRQTRSKFKETFDKVNKDLQHLFPQVFGGGTAWLELTEEDLLATGVTIMARPPGKKNSTISLLSGGEKALTALSLVFAIFRLNPAPFCMLDEVDAPLDEVNVGRFADLIARMSETVQFIFISHNRVTMEKADQLAGVTMQEPGVSRLVAVDIAQAVALAQ